MTTQAIISKTKRVDILGAAQNHARGDGLPSWVPHLNAPWTVCPFPVHQYNRKYSVATAEFRCDPNEETLTIEGHLLDHVGRVCEATPGSTDSSEKLHAVFLSFVDFVSGIEPALPTGRTNRSPDEGLLGKKEGAWLEFLSVGTKKAWRCLKFSEEGDLIPNEDDVPAPLQEPRYIREVLVPGESLGIRNPYTHLYTVVRRYCAGRRLGCTLEKRRVALFPAEAKNGDAIVRFGGSDYAYVVRSQGDGYVIVGEVCEPPC